MNINPHRAQALFLEALSLSEPVARQALLDRECAGDVALRGRVEALLNAHDATGGFGGESSGHDLPATFDSATRMRPGDQIGRYKLLEAIGEGGMGSVWVAQQSQPVKRKVALKLIKAGMDSPQILARFEAERQALAIMEHPNIAKVFDGGMTEQGRPYFVMEYVKGVPLTEYCDQARLSVNERLQLFLPVCQAVQHAHQKGIIHRDLKPSNILVCLYDGQPVPKVIDFGLAKALHQSLTEQSLYTAHGMMVGTPLYMSPEQAEHNNLDVDTRTDIYSLGVILYELLTGSTPLGRQQLKQAAYHEILRLIKEVEPLKPSTRLGSSQNLPSIAAQRNIDPRQLSKSLAGDLDWIVMKALDKERSRRYETANALARDIDRYLHEEAVEACPPSATYRLKKLLRRNKAQVIAVSLVLLTLLAGAAAVFIVQAGANANLRTVNGRLDQQRTRAVAKLYQARILLAQSALERNQCREAVRALEQTPEDLRGWEYRYLTAATDASLQTIALADHGMDLRFSPAGDRLFYSGSRICQRLDLTLEKSSSEALDQSSGYGRALGETCPNVAVNDSVTLAAICSQKGLYLSDFQNPPVELELPAQKTPDLNQPQSARMSAVAFSQGGSHLYCVDGGVMACWVVADRRLAWTMEIPGEAPGNSCWALAVSPHGSHAALQCDDRSIRLVDLGTRNVVATAPPLRNGGARLQFTGDSNRLVAHCDWDDPRLFAVPSLEPLAVVSIDGGWITVLSQDTQLAATGTQYGEVVLWDTSTGAIRRTLRGHREWVQTLAFSPDDGWLASGGRDRDVVLWQLSRDTTGVRGRLDRRLLGHEDSVLGLAFDETGQRLASGSGAHELRIWDLSRPGNPFQLPVSQGQIRDLQWFADQRRAAFAGYFRQGGQLEGRAEIWDLGRGKVLASLGPQGRMVNTVAISPDGRQAACGSDDGALVVWDIGTEEPLTILRPPRSGESKTAKSDSHSAITAAAWSADGATLVAGSEAGELFAYAPDTGRLLWSTPRAESVNPFDPTLPLEIMEIRFHGAGDQVCCWGMIGRWAAWLSVHDRTDGQTKYVSPRLDAEAGWAMRSDGSRIGVRGNDMLCEILMQESPALIEVTQIPLKPTALAYSRDGRWLAAGSAGGEILLFDRHVPDASAVKPIVLAGHQGHVSSLVFVDHDTRLVSGGWDHNVKVWSLPHGEELLTLPMGDVSDERVEHVFAAGDIVVATNGFPLSGGGDRDRIMVWNASGFRANPRPPAIDDSRK